MGDERGPESAIGDGGLVRALQLQRWRTVAAVEISPRLWEYFDEIAPILAVVEDIVDRWIASARHRLPLTGPDGFATAYLAAVEKDLDGQPWWQFCRLGANRRPVVDESYPKRVWTHHAGWLRRVRPARAVVAAVPEPHPGGLAGELVVERLRTEAAVDVAATALPVRWRLSSCPRSSSIACTGWTPTRLAVDLVGPALFEDRRAGHTSGVGTATSSAATTVAATSHRPEQWPGQRHRHDPAARTPT
jgi:hypothetical protein